MENIQVIERFGELTKEEPVSSLGEDLIIPGTIVLEAISPYFGYYNDAPMADKEPYLFFILEECHSIYDIVRATQEVRKQVNFDFQADLGSLQLQNNTQPVIRIRDCAKYCRIRRIQQLFEAEGIRSKRGGKKTDRQMALIRLQKFFYLEVLGDGLFLDATDPNKGYFALPRFMDWQGFKHLTTEAKYDTSILFFDAAQALYFENKAIVDLARVYREHLSVEKLREIRERYLKVLG
jgi:hypothetical protein